MLEIAASLHLLPGIWRDIHWRSLVPLVIGCWHRHAHWRLMFLTSIPAAPMQIALALFVLVVTCLLWTWLRLENHAGHFASRSCRSGSRRLLTAPSAWRPAGHPVLFRLACRQHRGPRNSLVAYFLLTDSIGLAASGARRSRHHRFLFRALTFLPALIAGVWLGARSFKNADPPFSGNGYWHCLAFWQ